MATRRTRQPRVISQQGARAAKVVGALRLGSAIATGATLVAVAELISDPDSATARFAVVCALIAGVLAYAELAWGGRAARAEERRLRRTILATRFTLGARIPRDDPTFTPASLIALATDNTERITEYRQVYFGATLAALAVPMVTLIAVGVLIDPVVGFGVLALVPLIPLLLGGFMHFFRKTSAASRTQRAHLSGRYLDAIRNLVTIRLAGAGPRVEHDLAVQGEANRGAIMKLLAGNQIVIIVMDGLFALVLICLTAGLTVLRADALSTSQIVAVMLLTILLLEPLQQVAGFFYIGMGGIASQKALRAFTRAAAEAQEPIVDPGAPRTDDGSGSSRVPSPDLAVEMHDVRFDHGRGPVLDGVDLEVPRGGRVAIIGPSGAGKSTLLALLRGTLPPQQGYIAVDGNVVDPTTGARTRASSATMSQSTWMFTGTIADNLRIARGDATDDELRDALARAQVLDEVDRMPHGVDTDLGEGAALVSGGQAQRISLARALLSQRRILLLDEPTSQVDIESEARIIDAIAALPRDLTIVMITHRHSLLDLADVTYELAEGRLHAREAVGV